MHADLKANPPLRPSRLCGEKIGPQRQAGDAEAGDLFLDAAGIRESRAAIKNQVHKIEIEFTQLNFVRPACPVKPLFLFNRGASAKTIRRNCPVSSQ